MTGPYVTDGPGAWPSPVWISQPGEARMVRVTGLTAGGFEICWPDGTLSFRRDWPRDLCPPPEEWPKVRILNEESTTLGPGRRAWKRATRGKGAHPSRH